MHELTSQDLPESMRAIAEIIGLGGALKLIEHYGGLTSLYVPQTIAADHSLSKALGVEAAERLSALYGGDCLRNIPRNATLQKALRDREIFRRKGEGAKPAALAREFGLTERAIWKILKRGAEEAAGGYATSRPSLPLSR